jgi:ribonuclease T2
MPRNAATHPASQVHRQVGRILAALATALLILLTPAAAKAPGEFDYYVLALSWSPTYCLEAGEDDRQQCGTGRRFAFVVHGLWPQHNEGWPEFCVTGETWVPQRLIEGMLDIMPSKRLIIHQWKKHGSCSGIAMADYFALTRALFASIRIPARYLSPQQDILVSPGQLETDFVKTNRGLTAEMLAVDCGRRRDRARLREVRVCFSKQGEFTACGANEARACRARTLVMPPVR